MSAWLMDEDGEMLSDYEDEEEDGDSEDEGEGSDGMGGSDDDEGQGSRAVAGGGLSDDDDDDEAGDSSAADDVAAAAEWRLVRQAALQDRDYPDEVDVPVDVSARQRFARFRCSSFTPSSSHFSPRHLTLLFCRGLKSLRTSPWDPKEQVQPTRAALPLPH